MQKNQPEKQQKKIQPGNILDRLIFFCLLSVLFIVPIVFSYWYRGGHELFFPIKIFFTQIPLIIALTISILKLIITKSNVSETRAKGIEITWVKSPLNLPLLAFFAAGLFSLIGSINVRISAGDMYRTFFYILFYFLFINYVKYKKEIRSVLVILLLAFAVVNFYGILQRFGIDLLAPIGSRTGVDSTLGNPDFYAGYLVALIPISLVCIFIVKREWRVFLGILTLTGIIFLFLTQSRAGFLGFFFSFLLFIFLILRREEVKKEAKTWILSIAGVAIALLIALSFKGGTTLSRIRESLNLKSTNIRFRLLCYRSTLNIFKDHFITGTGAGTFYNIYPKYRVPEMKEVFPFVETPKYAHNDFLQICSETGILGLCAFAWFLFTFFRLGISVLKDIKEPELRWLTTGTMCTFTGMLVQMIFDFPFYRPETTLCFFLMPAILSVVAQKLYVFTFATNTTSRLNSSTARPGAIKIEYGVAKLHLPGWSRAAIGFSAIIIIPFMVKWSFDPFLGNVHYNKGLRLERAYERTSDINQKKLYANAALKEFKKAISREKTNDIYFTHLGTFYGNLGRELWISDEEKKEYMIGAMENFDKALELCPYYAGAHYNSGQSYLFYGLAYDRSFIAKSEKRLKDAIALSSFSEAEFFHNQLGLLYKEQGMLDEAIREYEEALKINTQTIQPLINLGNVYYAKGQYDRAIEIYFRALSIEPNSVDALNNLANAYYQKRELGRAIETYKKAILINPNYIDAYNNLGSVYFVARMYPEAKAMFQKTLELAPPNSQQASYARSILSRIP